MVFIPAPFPTREPKKLIFFFNPEILLGGGLLELVLEN